MRVDERVFVCLYYVSTPYVSKEAERKSYLHTWRTGAIFLCARVRDELSACARVLELAVRHWQGKH